MNMSRLLLATVSILALAGAAQSQAQFDESDRIEFDSGFPVGPAESTGSAFDAHDNALDAIEYGYSV
jgi:hypothetical protein